MSNANLDIHAKIAEKKIIRAKVNLLRDEYKRIQRQIGSLKAEQERILAQATALEGDAQAIAEWLEEREYEYFKSNRI